MSDRTFIVKVTETRVTTYRLTIDEAMAAFPLVRWEDDDVSHAGDMEDEALGGAGLPPVVLLQDADDTDEEYAVRIWEE